MITFAIVWMWIVGIPPAYHVISKGGTTTLPGWMVLVMSHAWPITVPVLTVIGLAFKS